jgi:hypothetical protein
MPPAPMPSPQQVRVDPAELATTAAGVRRLAGQATEARVGAERTVGSLAQRLGPDLQRSVQEQWRVAATGLATVERDVATLAQALVVLADYFADLDRTAVPNRSGTTG